MDIKKYLEDAKEAYYTGNPFLTDDEYDAIEDAFGETPIGHNPSSKSVKHLYPLYSLKKYYRGEDKLPDLECIVSPKLDGAAIALTYINGVLVQVLTRGNGEMGEDVTHLFTHMACYKLGIPNDLVEGAPPLLQIVGELVTTKDRPNARNYVAGALSLKDVNEFRSRELYFYPYDVKPNISKFYQLELWHLHKEWGFNYILTLLELEQFPQDGLVYRVKNNDLYSEMGYTSKHPRGAFAVKKRSEGIETTLLDVVWQTGKSGKVTPVGILEPIVIDDATVTRATLNNIGFIEALDLQLGDRVMVERAGGIIPRIIRKVS